MSHSFDILKQVLTGKRTSLTLNTPEKARIRRLFQTRGSQQRPSYHSKNKNTSRIEILFTGHNNTLSIEQHQGAHTLNKTRWRTEAASPRERLLPALAPTPPPCCFGLTITYVLFFLSCATFVNKQTKKKKNSFHEANIHRRPLL